MGDKRIKYNPDSGVENPEANYDKTLVKAMEKLVKQVSDMEKLTDAMVKQIEKLTAKVNDLESVPERLIDLESRSMNMSHRVDQMSHDVALNSYDSHADDDLRTWMMAEKDKDATDVTMSGRDIARGIEDMNDRRRKLNM